MSRLERMKAALKLAELEEAFVEKKQSGEVTSKDRAKLREARMEYRNTYRVPTENGAQPETIGSDVEVEEV